MKLAVFILFIFLITTAVECKSKGSKQTAIELKETNTPNFIRLVVMRLIWGVATSVGLGERLSEFLGGAFVPPGVDYDDYGGSYFDADY